MLVEERVSLAELTTFRIGGPARFLLRVYTLEELREALSFASEHALPVLFLGGGSNILAADEEFEGAVIKIELLGVEKEEDVVIAAAGEEWDALVARAVSEGLWGIENLSGIPGTVGAAPIQNIGAYGAEVKDTLLWVEALDTRDGSVVRLSNKECNFDYRTSRFKQEPGRFCILKVAFSLTKNGTPNTSYKDLRDAKDLSLSQIRERVRAVRAGKFPDLSKEGTAGSFFLNPVVEPTVAHALTERFPELPQFAAEGGVKLSLAWLLDKGLNLKGLAVGGARLFEKQPLVIAASRDASAHDVQMLAEKVRALVKKEFSIAIEPEVRILK